VRDDKGKPQVKFTTKGSGTEVKSISTGQTIQSPYPIEKAYNALFSVGQISTNDGVLFNGKKNKTFNDDIAGEDISGWKRFLTPATKIKPGAKGEDINMYPLTVIDGPFNTVSAIKAAIKNKYPKAVDVLQHSDLMDELNDTNASDVEGFYLVKGPDYRGSGYTVVNGEDITLD
jgi:hypothetical protein